ncbi:MAG: outer membrane protein assembly factor BamD [Gemmatimonadetes bacterium]|nr:outer membrane protein assembly factor BamD [Gemmatimonadota bacterium]
MRGTEGQGMGRREPDCRYGPGLIPVALLSLLVACGPSMPPPDSTPRQRFDWSAERFEQGKYSQAIRGFRDHLFRDPLDPTADSARLMLAESYLESDQELLAANEFRQLATTRPNSPLADDAQFGICRSYWAMSPSIPRDQDFTRKTIEECSRLVEFYPRSPVVADARSMGEEARQKLATKEMTIGKWYFGRRMYESSIIYLESVLLNYPGSAVEPEVLGLLRDAYRYVGFRREAEQIEARLLETYPDSREARDIEKSDGSGSE